MHNQKMSKSLGNVVCPFDLIDRFGQDAVRLYILAEGPQSKDSNYSEEDLQQIHNGFIVDQYINLVARCLKPARLFEGPLVYKGHCAEAIERI